MSLVPANDVGGEGALRLLLSLSLLMSRPLPPEAVRNVAAAAAVIAGEREDEVVSVVLERSFDRQPEEFGGVLRDLGREGRECNLLARLSLCPTDIDVIGDGEETAKLGRATADAAAAIARDCANN